MPFYDDLIRVHVETHRGTEFEIYRARRGATCCTLDHYPKAKRCQACGRPIAAEEIYIGVVNGSEVTDAPTQEDAIEAMRSIIDDGETSDKSETDAPDPGAPPGKTRAEGDEENPHEELVKRMAKLGWPAKIQAILNDLARH